ncbi:hypothetical protein EDB85DRAFT_2156239 [Lactarius pseudohatsudake]|nr:hypothetical protein EDB85DRAFT_2156239 [Lactarius pseudohatsudake]
MVDIIVNVLYAFSAACNEGIGLAIFAGAGILLLVAITLDHPYVDYSDAKRTQVAKDVTASQDALVDIFERIESLLEEHSEVPTTEAMRDIVVKIMAEVLGILGIVTKEMKQGRAKRYQLEEGILKTR